MPRISICMIVKNAEKTLREALRSAVAAADEVVVVDTGSTDSSLDIAMSFVGAIKGVDVRLANYEWRDDFAHARNYSFALASGEWRMFLDADDVLKNGAFLKGKLDDLLRRHPHLNAVSMDYEYVKDAVRHQKIRLVRWFKSADDHAPLGWEWKDRIHEYLDLPGKQKFIATLLSGEATDIYVEHQAKSPEDVTAAEQRNLRILMNTIVDPLTKPDVKGRASFHLGLMMKNENPARAVFHFDQARKLMAGSTFDVYAGIEIARIHVEQKDFVKAKDVAASVFRDYPEFPLAQKTLAYVHTCAGDLARAALHFEPHFTERTLRSMTPAPYEDVNFEHVEIPAAALKAFLSTGNVELCERAYNAVDQRALQAMPSTSKALFRVREGQAALMQRQGVERLLAYVDYLLWQTEPVEALRMLKNAPSTLSHLPEVKAKTEWLEARLGHLKGWDAYKAHYASIPPNIYHTADEHVASTLRLARAQNLLAWARALPPDTEKHVLAIGAQDCHIEDAIMEACPGIRVTVCDVAPQASKGINNLIAKYGDRVSTHTMKHETDWAQDDEKFDAIVMFEVIEHLSHTPEYTFSRLCRFLVDRGELFLSCPVARRWIEPYLTSDTGPSWFGHVRAFNYVTLAEAVGNSSALTDGAFYINYLAEEFDGTFFLHATYYEEDTEIACYAGAAIVVPATPTPFHGLSHLGGHVGGSEEAVIHLADELKRHGMFAQVIAPVPEGYPIVRVVDNVWYRDINEGVNVDDMDCVLYWRCPHLVPAERTPYKKLLWLHDAAYGVDASLYNNADTVLVLSNAHAEALRANDGVTCALTPFQNGIDPDEFPALDDTERVPYSFIYSSSPDRGLMNVLDAWPEIRKQLPLARLDIYYDWSFFKQRNFEDADLLSYRIKNLEGLGVTFHGGVSHPELHAAMRRADMWLYPTFGDVETSCITAMKMAASGVTPIVTRAGALPETLDDLDAVFIENGTVNSILDGVARAQAITTNRHFRREKALQKFAWHNAARKVLQAVDSSL